jgi:translation initiation factor 4A
MARSVALNPASTPFFPGGLRSNDADNSILMGIGRQQDRSSLSVSPPEYHSAKSSPSPSVGATDSVRYQTSPGPFDSSRQSPTFRQLDGIRSIESRGLRENSLLSTLDTLPEADDNQENGVPALEEASGAKTPSSFIAPGQQPFGRGTPPVAVAFSNFSGGGTSLQRSSASPVSSLGSASQIAGSTSTTDGMASSFDSKLKTSPFMHEILDRLVRCEYSTREVQRDLGSIHAKVNLLLERTLATNPQPLIQPEFKDPFASGSSIAALTQPRPSVSSIAPNQHAPPVEDMPMITQRLNALTTSVGQLLALQTQQMQQQTSHPLEIRNSIVGLGAPQDAAPNQILAQPTLSPPSLIGHTLSNRPDLRPSPRQQTSTPSRAWSGDLPMRTSESSISRQEPMLRDKSRRSVSGLLRRDSSGVSLILNWCHPLSMALNHC